jgi:hypothetical protein
MSNHLSEEQLEKWISGAREETTDQHLKGCAQCRQEATELKQALAHFRDSIHTSAATCRLRWQPPAAKESRAAAIFGQRWAYAAMMAVVLVGSALLLKVDSRRPIAPRSDTVTDEALVLAIQKDIGREAPAALAPAELIAAEAEQALAAHNAKGEQKQKGR